MTNSNRFIVASHGWSGSNWLAYALNLNEHILCTHSARNILANDTAMHSNKNLKKNIRDFHKGYVSRQAFSIQDTYDKIIQLGYSEFYGSVHVLRLRDIPVINQKFGLPQEKYNLINLVRHPIDLVWSGYGQFKDLFRFDINELYWTLGKILNESKEFVYNIGDKYKINIGEIDHLAFIGAACVLGSLQKDFNVINEIKTYEKIDYLGIIKMEKITSNKNYFQSILLQLTNNQLIIQDSYLKKVFNTGKVNVHRHDKVKLNPKERYNSLENWQKEVLNFYLDKYQIVKEYHSYGYDFSFLK